MRSRSPRNRVGLILGVGLATVAVVLGAFLAGIAASVERSTVDVRFDLRGAKAAPAQVAVVAIDDVTFGDLRLRWPFPRRYHAQVIDRLHRAGAKVIAFDVQFSEPTADDRRLALAIWRGQPVALAATEVSASGDTNVLGGRRVLSQIGARAGSALLPEDPGGSIRRVAYALNGLESFSVVAAEQALGRRIPPSALGGDTAWIDYAGPPGTVATYSYSRVLRGDFPKDAFRGRVVVVGPSAPSLQDVHPTSVGGGQEMSGAELQANAIDTALRGFPLQPLPLWASALLLVALGMTMPVLSLRLRPLWALAAALGVGLLYAVVVQLAFQAGTIVPFLLPTVALVAAAASTLGVHYLLEAFERQRVRDTFARFVPDAVVGQVLSRSDGLRLGGEQVTATLMFTDLRGFTTFSEGRPAAEVIGILNDYLGEMTDAILAHGGTLVSFMGDGIMAVFGAPLDQPDHADRALATAREMLATRLPAVNARLAAAGHEHVLKMGIGLNTGLVTVGNVGSERRLEYTAIGDAVNTASRIEGLTKGSGYALFVADETVRHLHGTPPGLVDLGDLEIRGRSGRVRMWTLEEARV